MIVNFYVYKLYIKIKSIQILCNNHFIENYGQIQLDLFHFIFWKYFFQQTFLQKSFCEAKSGIGKRYIFHEEYERWNSGKLL
jgi:hypothetical protein